MKTKYALPMVLAGSVMLSGCWFDDDDDPVVQEERTSSVRIIHASPDAPPVNILVNGEAAFEGADYKNVALLQPAPGDYEVAVEGIIPSGNQTVIGPADFSFEANTRYNVIAVGSVSEIGPMVFVESEPNFSSSTDARLMIGHLAPNAPNVDIYVTAAGEGEDLAQETPLLTDVAFETVTEEAVVVPAGEYRI